MSSGPFVMLPIVWGWEYGARRNLAEVKERWFPLVKGVADFFACWLELDEADGFMPGLQHAGAESGFRPFLLNWGVNQTPRSDSVNFVPFGTHVLPPHSGAQVHARQARLLHDA